MNVIISKNHEESCRKVADLIIKIIKNNPYPMLGLATGGTSELVYKELVESYNREEVSFQNVSTINLDEYVGLPLNHEQSYRYYMDHHFFNKVDININNTYIPQSNADPILELTQFKNKLAAIPRNFQLLGIGSNGHIAFNEPAEQLYADAHIVEIASETIKANARYFNNENEVPKTAFTQGVGDILKAEVIALLATGANKAQAIQTLLLNDKITTFSPCTFLKTHSNTTIFIDQELADIIEYKNK